MDTSLIKVTTEFRANIKIGKFSISDLDQKNSGKQILCVRKDRKKAKAL